MSLFGVDLGNKFQSLKKAYKYRCALVHNGGIVTRRTIRELATTKLKLHEKLCFSWGELKPVLEAAHQIALTIDRKIAANSFNLEEIEQELFNLKIKNTLPEKKSVWGYFHKLGMHLPGKRDRELFLRKFYV
jgi:hypothetical protein